MDLQEQAQLIEYIRSTFEEHKGKKIHVEQDLGRSRISAHTGVILQVTRKRAPKARLSYQFADILTGVVKVELDGEQLFEDYRELLTVKKEPYNPEEFLNMEENEERIIT